ncbi:MAG: BTAD domain-containing putative transcriptional regulator [Caldilineaceae bacterium]
MLSISPREEALLIYVACQGIAISRTQLCNLFWPGEKRARARGNLRKLLADIRKSMNGFVQNDREAVWLTAQHYWLDVHEFQRHTHVLTQNFNLGRPISEMDILRLAEGVRLYHGDFLANFKQPQSMNYTAWIEEEQSALQQRALTAFKLLIAHAIQKRQLDKATMYVRQILALDPLDEESNAQFMRLLANQQQISEALNHYRHYEQQLKQTTRATVEPEIVEIYQQLRGGIVPAVTTGASAFVIEESKWFRIKSTPIPNPLTPLIGRTMLLTQLHQYLQNPTVRLLTLTGLGGVGKTRLALALANQAHSYFADGVLYVPLERTTPQTEPAAPLVGQGVGYRLVVSAIAKALNLSTDATHMPLDQQILLHLNNANLLLLLDSFEYFVEGAQFLVHLLEAAPLVKVVVASREILQLPGEVVIQIEGLGFPNSTANRGSHNDRDTVVGKDNQDFDPQTAPAIQLFITCAQLHNQNLTFTATCQEQITEICYLLGWGTSRH